MLQRAASNAYSWWWASHMRTKQSNWLEQNLQDMETNLQTMMQLIEQDGDTFAQRAEMYYKRRPELIHIVQEFYKGYRAVAERYDHISGDLHNARSTIATVFPEQVPSIASDTDPPEEEIEQVTDNTKIASEPPNNPAPPPPPSSLSGKSELTISKKSRTSDSVDSHLKIDKETAQKEIDKHQKEILVLQTEREVFKSSYEGALAKYWEVENQILELQAMVCCLQEDHGLGSSIQSEEEQTLMAATALRSCEQMLGSLQEEQKKSMAESKLASEKIKQMEKELKHFKDEFLKHQPENNKFGDEQPRVPHPSSRASEPESHKLTYEQPKAPYPVINTLEEEMCNLKKEKTAYQEACQKIVKQLEIEVDDPHIFPELSHLIDELVGKVVNLEGEVSSQNVQILRLKTETDTLQERFQCLLEGNTLLVDDTKTMNNRINDVELELQGIQDLNLRIEEQKTLLQNHLAEACYNLDDLAGKMKSQQNPNEDENSVLFQSGGEDAEFQEAKVTNEAPTAETDKEKVVDKKREAEANNLPMETEKCSSEFDGEVKRCEEIEESYSGYETEAKSIDWTEESSSEFDPEVKSVSVQKSDAETFNFGSEFQNLCLELVSSHAWQRFLEGIEGKEKPLLTEYTSVLCKYNEAKQKLSEVEKQNQDLSKKVLKIRSLESTTERKDAEIESLKQKLSILQTDYEHPDVKSIQGNSLAGSKSHKLNSSRMLAAIGCLDYQSKENSEQQNTASPRIKDAPATEKATKMMLEGSRPASAMGEKFRFEIDSLLEENLDFWIRFSASFHQIQKYQSAIQEAQVELLKLRKEKNVAVENHTSSTHGGSTNHSQTIRSSVEAIQKQLRELQGELLIWIEQNALLKDELKHRSTSLCSILDELFQVSKVGSKEAGDLTDYQAAKFQGEILNMQQENKKVADELQAGLDHVRGLQLEIEKDLLKLKENFGLSGSKHHHNNHLQSMRQTLSRTRIPLRTFIFGKPKKPSLFSCMNPALQKQYSDMRAGRKI